MRAVAKLLEAGVEGGGEGVVEVVVGEEGVRVWAYCWAESKGSRGKVGDVDRVLAGLPVDVIGGRELTVDQVRSQLGEAVGDELAGVVDSGGELARLEDHERCGSFGWSRGLAGGRRARDAEGGGDGGCGIGADGVGGVYERRPVHADGEGEERAVGAEEDGVGQGEDEERQGPAGRLMATGAGGLRGGMRR